MTQLRGDTEARGIVDRVLAALVRVQTPLGLLLVVAGFTCVFLGWLEASGTADVRVQMQDLISGGVGGLGMIIIGGVLLQSALADRAARRTETALDRLADALGVEPRVGTRGQPGLDAPQDSVVLATHASFHREGCDLLEDRERDELTRTSEAQARRRRLQSCRVCFPGSAGT
jgi:hypothetical protein